MKHRTPNRKSLLVIALLVTTLLLLSSPIAAVATPAAAGVRIHVVQRGENLTSIAARYGVSISAIMQANGISDANRIYFGQRLTIPSGSSSAGAAYTSSAGTAYTGSACAIHVVRLGDYLGKIAAQYGVTVQGIQQANGLMGTVIWPGLRLKIPCTSAEPKVGTLSCHLRAGKYLIRPGDTLLKIALRCNTSVAALRRANGLSNDFIRAGAWLIIPGH
jgi:LysM repeat protein